MQKLNKFVQIFDLILDFGDSFDRKNASAMDSVSSSDSYYAGCNSRYDSLK